MAERAGVFVDSGEFDVTAFTPKPSAVGKKEGPSVEEIRAVSEKADFHSREPARLSRAVSPSRPRRKHRTGRNIGLNIKVTAPTVNLLYEITERQGWVLGETLQHALAALERELASTMKDSGKVDSLG